MAVKNVSLTQRFAVFRHPENPPESWRSWSAYTRDFNTAWRGFVGFYEGHGATRRERKADAIKRARADNRDPMDGIDPTPPAPADAKCNAPGCSVCAAGLPHTTHSYPMTAPAPADDAREKGLAAYDALNMREKSEIAAQAPRYCYAKGYVAALAGRADDAGGAEAMREASGHSGEASKRATAFVEAMDASPCPHSDADWSESDCGYCLAAALDRFAAPLPAGDDAVEEAAKRVTTAYKDLRELMERRRGGGFAVSVNLGPLYEACDALDAALRRAKGGA